MKEILLTAGISILTTAAPVLYALFATRKKTDELGQKLSKIGNRKIGKKIMSILEMSGVDFLNGMLRDNGKKITVSNIQEEDIKKEIHSIKDKSNL